MSSKISPWALGCTTSASSPYPTRFFLNLDHSPTKSDRSCSATYRSATTSSKASPFSRMPRKSSWDIERCDGSGYPRGLKAEEIPVGARIFAVADTFDAMTSDRPYRRALPFKASREVIERGAGKQYDPQVARVFLSIPDETWEVIRRETADIQAFAFATASCCRGLRQPVESGG